MFLDLKHNRINDEGGVKICENLMNNKSLNELNLSANSLSHEFCKKFCELIRTNQVLIKIDLSCNFMDDADGQEVLKTLDESPHIIVFDIRNNKIQNAGKLFISYSFD